MSEFANRDPPYASMLSNTEKRIEKEKKNKIVARNDNLSWNQFFSVNLSLKWKEKGKKTVAEIIFFFVKLIIFS